VGDLSVQEQGREAPGVLAATVKVEIVVREEEDIVRMIIMVQLHTVLGVSPVPSGNGPANRWREV